MAKSKIKSKSPLTATYKPKVGQSRLGRLVKRIVVSQLFVALLVLAIAGAVSWRIVHQTVSWVAYVPQNLSECQRATAKDFQCYAKYYASLDYNKGDAVALSDMETAYKTDQYVVSQCHQLAHIVGRTSFEKTSSLEKTYANGTNFCMSGFYHGAIEQAIKRLGPDKIKQSTAKVCESFAVKKPYSLDHFNCVHGLGHGLMAVADYNLPNALKLCDSTSRTWEQQSCYGGVFMENVMVAIRGDGTSAYLDAKRPLYPCTIVDTTYKQQCYLMQTSYILQHNGYNFANAFEECSKADEGFTADCYQSGGRDVMGSVNNDFPKTAEICRSSTVGNNDALRNCMIGSEREYTSYYPHDNHVLDLCAAFGGEIEVECRSDVGNR